MEERKEGREEEIGKEELKAMKEESDKVGYNDDEY